MRNEIILKSGTFKYPTKEERNKIKKFIPEINRLKIDYKSATIEILRASTFEKAIRNEDIYWWNNCLDNRLGKLTETYIYIRTHFLRLQSSDIQKLKNKHTEKILLDYYIEIFYYYYFSTRDILGQLLNLIYELKIEEHKIFLSEKNVEKIKNRKMKDALSDFLSNTKDSYNIRNSFNHRFTPTQQDFRAKKNIIKANNRISFYSAQEIQFETFVDDTENLMKYLGCLMNVLSKEIK